MITALLSIAILHWAVLLVPGFNFLLIGQLAAGGSRRAAIAAVLGMTTSTLMWALLAVGGVGAVFHAHPMIRQIAQISGGLYLLWLAWGMLKASSVAVREVGAPMHAAAAFRAGFITSALNPKIALFYGSVFATALPAQPQAWQVLAAVALVYANSWIWHGALAFALSRPSVQRAYLAHYGKLTKASALIVSALGLRMIFSALKSSS